MDAALIEVEFHGGTDIISKVSTADVSDGEITDCTFEPQLVYVQASALASVDSKSNRQQISIGWANNDGGGIQQAGMVSYGGAGAAQSDIKQSIVTASSCAAELRAGVIWELVIDLFTSTGVEWTGSDSSVVHMLFLSGEGTSPIVSSIDVIDKSDATGPVVQSLGLPFNWTSMVTVGTCFRTSETDLGLGSAGRTWSVGTWYEDDQTQRGYYSTDENDATNRDSVTDSDAVCVSGDLDAVIDFEGIIEPTIDDPSSGPDIEWQSGNPATLEKILVFGIKSQKVAAAGDALEIFFHTM
jgi:hypothetical protein